MITFARFVYRHVKEGMQPPNYKQFGYTFQKRLPTREAAAAYKDVQGERWELLIAQAIHSIPKSKSDVVTFLKRASSPAAHMAVGEAIHDLEEGYLVIDSPVPLLDDVKDVINSENDAWKLIGTLLIWFGDTLESSDLKATVLTDPGATIGVAQMAHPGLQTIEHLVEAGDEATRKIDEISDEYEKTTKQLQAAIKKVREESIFRSASLLWKQKATRHTVGYFAGFAIILSSLAVIAKLASDHAQAFLAAMPLNMVTGEFTYLAVFIVGLMFVALAWIYRMLGRFVLDNFTLASDARQRSMILQTFLTLVGTPEAKMQDGERVLILNAIFRPAPGQGSDDPAPSSLVDLMKGAFPAASAAEKKG